MPRQLLNDLQVRRAKPDKKPYRLADGGGLFLYVPPSGVRSWQYRYKLGGKAQTATLGKAESLSLAEARTAADDARKAAGLGAQLTTLKRVAKARRTVDSTNTFRSVAASWAAYQSRKKQWLPSYREEVEASIRNHLGPLLLLPVSDIVAPITAPIIDKADRAAPDMAQKVEQRLLSIMDFAVRRGLLLVNPLPRPERSKRTRKHFAAVLDRKDVGAIMRSAEGAECFRGVRRAHLLLAFTAQRIGSIITAEWSEFDLDAGLWSIPREHMKRKDAERGAHLVPLTPKLVKTLREWKAADGDKAHYVTPAPAGGDRPITHEAVEKFYRRSLKLTGKHSPHSWRSVFSTWARDAGKNADVVESQLDHVVGNKVAAAYDRSARLELRKKLMLWYEGQLTAARDGAEVVQLRGSA